MNLSTQYLPSYSVGENAYDNIANVCSAYGRTAVVVGGQRAIAAARPYLEQALSSSDIEIVDYIWYGGEASMENAVQLLQNGAFLCADMVFAVGGGKACDCSKYACDKLDKPYFTFPTIASNMASMSSEAIMYYPTGQMRDIIQLKQPARHVFINTRVIAEAPDTYLWAGIGDTMAKYFETSFASRGRQLAHADALAIAMSEQSFLPLLKYGEQALADCRANRTSPELDQVCLCIIVTTGLVSIFIDYRLNASVAHAVFCGMTALPQIEQRHLHGEVVAYGVLVLLCLDGQNERLEQLLRFYQKVGLPTCLADIEVAQNELEPVINAALAAEDLECTPYDITFDMLYQAMLALEARREQLCA